jgi:hypothetical protein
MFDFQQGKNMFLYSTALSLEIKRPERESDLPISSSAEVKNGEAISPLSHISSQHGA